MELHQLRYVVAVADTGSFSRAAEKLSVVQSNVSAQVRKLELELGVALFDRRAHEVVLTEFGQAFLPAARQALEATRVARATVDAVRGLTVGRAALGVPGTLVGWLLSGVVRRFQIEYPTVDLWVTEEASAILAGMVASRDLSQALVNVPCPHADLLDLEPLFDEELVAVVPRYHPLAGRGRVQLDQLCHEEWLLPENGNPLRDAILEACAEAGFTPRTRIEIGRKQLMREMALDGLGVALMPAMTAQKDLIGEPERLVRVEGPRTTRSIGLVRHQGDRLSVADCALRAIIRDCVRARVGDAQSWVELAQGASPGALALGPPSP
jgi:LysR family hydrogen peroxide-inducible transcriptional activator